MLQVNPLAPPRDPVLHPTQMFPVQLSPLPSMIPSPDPVHSSAHLVAPSSRPPTQELVPGSQRLVGQHSVVIEKYLSSGAFAHVYQVRTPVPIGGTNTFILKRVVVPEKHMLDEVRREVEVMKLLRNHPNIVNLIDADAFHLPDGNHEVLILMESCLDGGIISLMNTRLQNRFTTAEVLQIFIDVCEGLSRMHSLSPPLAHMDLKVENVLQAGSHFKLCDFGSVRTPRKGPESWTELKALELDVGTSTTQQYRAPELVNLSQAAEIDEKADIWALGVFLYKICYFTTPFEAQGPEAVINVSYVIPPYPVYPPEINLLIGSMLQAKPTDRPPVVEILQAAHSIRGTQSRFFPTPVSTPRSGRTLLEIITSVPSPSSGSIPLTTQPSVHLQHDHTPNSRSHTLPVPPISQNMPPLHTHRAISPLSLPVGYSSPASLVSHSPQPMSTSLPVSPQSSIGPLTGSDRTATLPNQVPFSPPVLSTSPPAMLLPHRTEPSYLPLSVPGFPVLVPSPQPSLHSASAPPEIVYNEIPQVSSNPHTFEGRSIHGNSTVHHGSAPSDSTLEKTLDGSHASEVQRNVQALLKEYNQAGTL